MVDVVVAHLEVPSVVAPRVPISHHLYHSTISRSKQDVVRHSSISRWKQDVKLWTSFLSDKNLLQYIA